MHTLLLEKKAAILSFSFVCGGLGELKKVPGEPDVLPAEWDAHQLAHVLCCRAWVGYLALAADSSFLLV